MICIKNCTLISMENENIQKNIDILIENDKITKIAPNIDIKNIEIIDATGKIVMPGLINTHAHIPMSIFRETLDGYNLQDWLTKKIWPMEDKLTNEDIYNASYLSFIEMIKTGTTTINDMYFMTEDIIKACLDTGVRLQTTRTLINNQEDGQKKLQELEEILKKYKDKYDTITFNAGIHGLYTTQPEYIDACIKLAKKYSIPVHMHFCENTNEVEDIKKIHHQNPVDIIIEKFKDTKLILAHCVKLEEQDIEKLKKLDISISHCPISNLKLGCGIAKINYMNEQKLNISLGTDGQGSGSNLDLFETMKTTALLQKGILENPEKLNAYEILKMATINGAKALGLEKEIGSIKEGKKADIIILNMNDVILKPVNNILSQIVYNVKGSNVETTIVNGKVLMQNKKLMIKEFDIYEKCEEIIKRISE